MIAVFDIGGTSIKYGVMKPSMNTLEFDYKDEFASDAIALKGSGIVKNVIKRIQELSLQYKLSGVGISTAGMVDAKTGTILYANENIPEYTGINLKKEIENICGLPCWVENDVNAAALGEASYGAGKNVLDMMMLTIGTGIGGAIILNGKVYTGHSNSAGEIGYMMINGKQFQDIASTTYLVNNVKRLCKEDTIDGKIIFERAKQNDEICKKEIDMLCDHIVQGITNCVCLMNSQKIVLGGGIMAQEEYLSPIIHRYADMYINEEMKKHTTIEFAKLGNLAGMAGAGMNFLEEKDTSMHKVVQELMGKVIISCQAYEDTPMYGPEHMKAMAESVLLGGADGIRACWPQDIRAIRSITDKPIVGIYKEFADGDPLDQVFITPSFERACEVIEAGADILGVDCTIRENRGLEELTRLLIRIKEAYPNIAIMADLATVEEGELVAQTGLVDIISTTLNGYTRSSLQDKSDTPNIQMIKDLKKRISIPVNGEGRLWTLEDMNDMLDAGADMITIGTVITRPHLITQRFMTHHRKYVKK